MAGTRAEERRAGFAALWAAAVLAAAGLSVAGCARNTTERETRETNADTAAGTEARPDGTDMEGADRARAELQPTQGNQVHGTVTFEQTAAGVRVRAELEGLSPGVHGFHIHEFGDCTAPDASSAGDHWNPMQHTHGAPEAATAERHLGDLGNITAGKDGKATYDRVDSLLAITGTHSIVGHAVIVHAQADDLTSQPSGNAGSRLACGVIRLAGGPAQGF
jgi:Cu-Zn family superoxide dismutase